VIGNLRLFGCEFPVRAFLIYRFALAACLALVLFGRGAGPVSKNLSRRIPPRDSFEAAQRASPLALAPARPEE
jgi:hypothetical protein